MREDTWPVIRICPDVLPLGVPWKRLQKNAEDAEDAKKEWLTAALESGVEIAEPASPNGYSGQFKLRIPKSLHRRLAERSKEEGGSMNQYCVYLLSRNDALESAE